MAKNQLREGAWAWMKRSLVLNAFLAAIAGVWLYGAYRVALQAREASHELRRAEQELSVLRQKKQGLRSRLRELETPEGVEREAKARLNLKNPGEEVVVVVPDDVGARLATSSSAWWARALDFVRSLVGK